MIHVKPNLSDQQVCFCDEYLVNFNAFRSAISAGYSENTARKGELLHMPKIQEYLRLKMQHRSERIEISHDMILRELAKVAFSSMGNYYDERGQMKPMCELTETEKAAISHYQILDAVDGEGDRIGTLSKITLHNKMSALDKIARHLGFYGVGKKSGEQEAKKEETQESRTKNQEEEGFVVNGEGELIAEVNTEDVVMLVNAGALESSAETTEKILTLSPPIHLTAQVSEPEFCPLGSTEPDDVTEQQLVMAMG